MKKLVFFFSFLSLIIITVYSCRKTDLGADEKQNVIVNTQSFESTDVTDAELVDFLDDFDEDTVNSDSASNFVDIEVEETIYLLETAAGAWMVDYEASPNEVSYHNFTITATVSNVGGDLMVDSGEIISVYSEIYDRIVDTGSNVSYENTSLYKFIAAIDLSLGSTTSTTADINVNFMVANDVEASSGCTYTKDWIAIYDDGGCNSNTATTGDAQKRLNKVLNHHCGRSLDCALDLDERMGWKNISSQGEYDDNKNHGYDLWWNSDDDECRLSSEIQDEHDGIIQLADDEKPYSCPTCSVSTYKEVQKYGIRTGIVSTLPSAWFNRVTIYYGDCIAIPIPPDDYLPEL